MCNTVFCHKPLSTFHLVFLFQPLKPAGNSGNSYFDNFASTPAPSAPAPAPAPAAVSSFSLDSSAGSSVASGSVWASLSGSQKMKVCEKHFLIGNIFRRFISFSFYQPLKPAGNSGNSYFDNFASAPAPSPLPTPTAGSGFSLDSSAGSSVASGSVWSSLSGSQRMKVSEILIGQLDGRCAISIIQITFLHRVLALEARWKLRK